MTKALADSELKDVFTSLKSEKLSETVPQIAEIREYKDEGDDTKGFFLSKMVLNKPMLKILGINGDTAMTSLHTGIKYQPPNRLDSIAMLKAYYDYYANRFNTLFKDAKQENEMIRIEQHTSDGKVFFEIVWTPN